MPDLSGLEVISAPDEDTSQPLPIQQRKFSMTSPISQKKGSSVTTLSDPEQPPLPIYGYDRIRLWIDQPELPVSTDYFDQHCTEFVVSLEQMHFNARWKLKLDIFQPTITFLERLLKVLGSEIATHIVYVELACDTTARSQAQAQQWQHQFLTSAKLKYQQQPVVTYEGTDYFGRRNDGTSWRGQVMAVYSDKPSKLNNAQPEWDALPCLHIEQRVSGSNALATCNIVSLHDLIRLDISQFFDDHVRIYSLPYLTELGRLLARIAKANTDVSPTALRKRANKWLEQHCSNGHFSMQNALLATPHLAKNLETTPFSAWLQTMLVPSRGLKHILTHNSLNFKKFDDPIKENFSGKRTL